MAGLALIERLLAPAIALLLFRSKTTLALGLTLVLGGLLTTRGAIQRDLAVRNEAELYRLTTRAILEGDVLRPTLLPGQDARVALFQGLMRVASLLADTLPNLVANAISSSVMCLVVIALEPWRISAAAFIALVVGGTILFLSRRRAEGSQSRAWSAWNGVSDQLSEACEGRLDLVASGRYPEFLTRFSETTIGWDRSARRAARIIGIQGRLPIAAAVATVGAAVVLDARLRGQSWSVALFGAALLGAFAPAFLGMARCLQEVASSEHRVAAVECILAAAMPLPSGTGVPRILPSHVECRRVTFAYDPQTTAVAGVSFVWSPGEILALAGANGSGKSTCLGLLLGLARPASGTVLIDGMPLDQIDPLAWRRSVAFLPQKPYVAPHGSVRDSLAFTNSGLEDSAMLTALERVRMLAPLRRHATDPLSARVGALSAGERQRLAIARVLCNPAPVVVLDEPDASLDQASVILVRDLLLDLARDRMVLFTAHTPELLEVADRVITLENGRVLDQSVKERRAIRGKSA